MTPAKRYPGHIPRGLAECLGQPPFELYAWWMVLRELGVDVPKRYEGETSAALHFLIPFAIQYPDNWEREARLEIGRLRDGGTFRPAQLTIALTAAEVEA